MLSENFLDGIDYPPNRTEKFKYDKLSQSIKFSSSLEPELSTKSG